MKAHAFRDTIAGIGIWLAARPVDGFYQYDLMLSTRRVGVTIRGHSLTWYPRRADLLFSERYAGRYGVSGWRRSGWWGHVTYQLRRAA